MQARHESRDHHQKTTLLPAFPLLVAQYEQMVEQAEYASLQCNVNPLAAPIVIKLVMVAQATIAVKLPSTATKPMNSLETIHTNNNKTCVVHLVNKDKVQPGPPPSKGGRDGPAGGGSGTQPVSEAVFEAGMQKLLVAMKEIGTVVQNGYRGCMDHHEERIGALEVHTHTHTHTHTVCNQEAHVIPYTG